MQNSMHAMCHTHNTGEDKPKDTNHPERDTKVLRQEVINWRKHMM